MASRLSIRPCASHWLRRPIPLHFSYIRTKFPFHPTILEAPSPALTIHCRTLFGVSEMMTSGISVSKEMQDAMDKKVEDECTSISKLLQEFNNFSTINKAWVFKSDNGNSSRAMFSVGQSNFLANKKKTSILSSHILKENGKFISFEWSPFPVEMIGVSAIVPSPSGSKLLVVRIKEDGSPTQLEIWGPSLLQKEIHVPQSVHGSIYTDGWFEGISWNHDETLIAYIAEEPTPPKPMFDRVGYKSEASDDKNCGTWKGQGEWEEHWGETYSSKKRPTLFVASIDSEEIRIVQGIKSSLSVGQVVWAPSLDVDDQYLVFVGWREDIGPQQTGRKLGIKYCYNRPCSLYAVHSPFCESEDGELQLKDAKKPLGNAINLTEGITSAFFPRFSPDGKSLVFLSAKSSVDTGAHCATNSLHRIEWPASGQLGSSMAIVDVVPVVLSTEDDSFPGLYCSSFLDKPWLSDGHTMILSSIWRSLEVVLSVNILSGKVLRISPTAPNASWNVLAVDGDNILAVSSSPINPPQVRYGCYGKEKKPDILWDWLDVPSPFPNYSDKVNSLLSTLQFDIMKIAIKDVSENLTKGASSPFEAIFVSSKNNGKNGTCDPLIVVLHGGPHSVSLASYSKSLAFLSSLGYSLLIVNYRGSLGFGEEALQSLPGKIGCQDVGDVLTALDHIIGIGLADPSKVAVLGGSHGGFLTTHLIGQAPDRFVAAAARNPVCSLALMVGTSDIPDWCYVEAYGSEGRTFFTEAPSVEQLSHLYKRSPVAHLSKVKTPILFLLGNQDLRVPISNGLQYARALKEKGCTVKVIVFPDDNHPLDRPQTDYESFLNIGVWFKKFCK